MDQQTTSPIRREFIDLSDGQVHYRIAGSGETVLLLHQTPRSSDEFLDVIPRLARHFRVIAMDTIGYGDSYKPKKRCSVEGFAKVAVEMLNKLHISKINIIGHHTGAVIAVEIATSHPKRVRRLVLSGCGYVDDAKRKEAKKIGSIDKIEFNPNGTHLLDLWNRRIKFYPKNRPDIIARYIIDALKAGDNIEDGHIAGIVYRMEQKLGRIKCPTLLIYGTGDPFSYPDRLKVKSKIKGARLVCLKGGMVPIIEQMPQKFCATLEGFFLN